MKTYRVILLVFVIVSVGIVLGLLVDFDTYSDFVHARKNPGKDVQIIGNLDTSRVISYDSTGVSPTFSFYLKDEKGYTMKVIYRGAKPRDFEKLQQIVITGRAEDSVFIASKLLLKCPSKYNTEQKPAEYKNIEFKN